MGTDVAQGLLALVGIALLVGIIYVFPYVYKYVKNIITSNQISFILLGLFVIGMLYFRHDYQFNFDDTNIYRTNLRSGEVYTIKKTAARYENWVRIGQ